MVGLPESLVAKSMRAVAALSIRQRIFSVRSAQGIAASLSEADLDDVDPARYLSGAFFLSVAFFFLAFAALALVIDFDAFDSAGGALISFALAFLALAGLPSAAAGRRNGQIESELPFVLREFSVYLDIGLPFERALAKIAGRDYTLSREMSAAYREIRSGASVQSAFHSVYSRSSSLALKRSLMLLSSAYETGTGTEAVKRAAEDLASSQIAKMRLQAGKLSLAAVAFVATSALMPAMFSVFAAVSPLLSGPQFSQLQIWLAFVIAFPAMNLVSLAAMFLLLPAISAQGAAGGRLVGDFLSRHGFAHGSRAFAAAIAAASVVLAAISFIAGQMLLSMLCLCAAPVAYSFVQRGAAKEVESAEACLPDALYGAASLHRLLSAERLLSFLALGGFGRLSVAFALAARRQQAGEGFARSMQAASEHCPSPLVKRAIGLLAVAYESGANMHAALRETAQDTAAFFALVRERAAVVSVQRYTVLAASSLLVPFILGTAVSLSPSLSSASVLLQPGAADQSSHRSATQAYLLLNSALSALMLALSESDAKKALLYFSAIAPLSQLAFAAASSGALSLLAA